jgi:hypothetical protein
MRESDELVSAFTELETFVRETSRLPGLAAARSEADRRRRGRLAVWSAAAAAFLVLAGTAVVANWLPRSGDTGLEPSPWVTAEPTPSPSGTRGPLPMVLLSDMTPPDRLRNASLDVPAFDFPGCPSGRLQFVDASFVSPDGGVRMEYATVGDVDSDGLDDVVVVLRCTPAAGEHGIFGTQAVAYSGPTLTLLGSIPTGGLTVVHSLQMRPNAVVELGMVQTGLDPAIVLSRYWWSGSGFDLIERIDVLADDAPAVAVSAEPTAVQLVPGGPAATIVVTVRSDGPYGLSLPFSIVGPAPVTVEVEGLAGVAADGRRDVVIVGPPKEGRAVTITLRIALPAGATLPAGSTVVVAAYTRGLQHATATVALQS